MPERKCDGRDGRLVRKEATVEIDVFKVVPKVSVDAGRSARLSMIDRLIGMNPFATAGGPFGCGRPLSFGDAVFQLSLNDKVKKLLSATILVTVY